MRTALHRATSSLPRRRALTVASSVWALALLTGWSPLGVSDSAAACSDTVLVRSAKTYSKTGSSTVLYVDTCTVMPVPGRRFLLEVLRPGGSNALDTARVAYGGVEYFGADDVDVTNTLLSRVITAKGADSTLRVTLVGGSGTSSLVVRVTQVPEPLYSVYATTVSGATNAKSYTKYFSFAEEVPASPHVMVFQNGSANLSDLTRSQGTEVWVNGQEIVLPNEVTYGRAYLTRNVTLYADNTVQINFPGNQSGRNVTIKFYGTDVTPPEFVVAEPTDSLVTRAAKVLASVQLADSQSATRLWLDGAEKSLASGAWSDSLALPTQDGKTTFTFAGVNGACLTDTVRRTVIRDTQTPTLELVSPAADTTLTGSTLVVVGRWVDSTRTVVSVDGDTASWAASGPTWSYFVSDTLLLDYGTNGILIRAVDAAGNVRQFKRYIFRIPTGGTGADSTESLHASTLSETEGTDFASSVAFLYSVGPDTVQKHMDPSKIVAGTEAVIRGRVVARDHLPFGDVRVQVLGHPEFGYTLTRNDGRFDLVVNGGRRYVLRFMRERFLELQRTVEVPILDYALVGDVAMVGYSERTFVVSDTAGSSWSGRFESDANGDRQLTMLFEPGTRCSVTTASGTSVLSEYRVRLKEYTVGQNGDEAMPATLPPATAYTYCVEMSVAEADTQVALGDEAPDVRFNQPVISYVRNFLDLPVATAMPSGYYDRRLGKWLASEDGIVVRLINVSGGLANLDTDGDSLGDAPARYDSLGIGSFERARIATHYASGDVLIRTRIHHFCGVDLNPNVAAESKANSPNGASAGQLPPLIECPLVYTGCIVDVDNRVLGEEVPIVGTPYFLSYRSSRAPGDKAMRWIRIPLTSESPPAGLAVVYVTVDIAGRRYAWYRGNPPANDAWTFDLWNGRDAYNRPVFGTVTATVRIGYQFQMHMSTGRRGTSGGQFAGGGAPSNAGLPTSGDRDIGQIIWTTQKVSVGVPSTAAAGLGGWTISPHHIYDTKGRGTLLQGDGTTRYANRLYPTVKVWGGNGQHSANDGLNPGDGTGDANDRAMTPRDLAARGDGSVYVTDGPRGMVGRIGADGKFYRVAGKAPSENGDPPTDGMDAKLANLADVRGVTEGPDGSVYFVEYSLKRVFRVDPSGKLWTVAGQSGGTFREDTLAVHVPLTEPTSVAVASDGTVFVGDQNRIFRIGTNGRIRTYAGNGTSSPNQPGNAPPGRADSLAIVSCDDLAVDNNGALYIAETGSTRIRVVSSNGILSTLVYTPTLWPSSLAIGPDGLLYFTQKYGTGASGGGQQSVFKREADGTLSIVAGGNSPNSPNGGFTEQDGKFGRGAVFDGLSSVSVGPDGTIFVGEFTGSNYSNNSGVFRISPELPGTSATEFLLPSRDGSLEYAFSSGGRHLRTRDARTQVRLHEFGYTNGRLTSITDSNARTTSIVRDPSGTPTAIVAPYGQVTTLTLSGDYLRSVTNPNDETYSFTYDASGGGLLKSLTNPRGKTWEYRYADVDGRLEYESDQAGGSGTLAIREQNVTREATRTTALNRVVKSVTQRMMDGFERRFFYDSDGSVSTYVDSVAPVAPYGQVLLATDKTEVTRLTRTDKDPRYGWFAPVPATTVTTLPASHTPRTVASARSTSTDRRTFAEETTLNGATQPYRAAYDTVTKQWTLTTPYPRTSRISLNAAGQPVRAAFSALIDSVEFGYDGSGNLKHLSQGERAWRYTYDDRGRLKTVTDTLGRVSIYEYGLADRESLLTLPGNRVVRLRYDASGNLEGLTPPSGNEHAFTYSAVDLNETYVPPSIAGIADPITTYFYNADRQLTDILRPDSSRVRLRYNDTRGWLDSLTIARGRTTLTHGGAAGMLTVAVSPDSVVSTYAWDGPVLIRETLSGAASGAVARMLNIALAESTQTVVVGTDSSVASYIYGDADGLLTGVSVADATETISRRVADGLITGTSVSAGGGTVTSAQDYNSFGELYSLSYSWPGGGAFSQSLERDALGRITQVTETVGDSTRVLGYHYDAAGRLDTVWVDGARVRAYEYDQGGAGNGNRTAEYAFDGLGDPALIARGEYDAQDRLERYGLPSGGSSGSGNQAAQIVYGYDTAYEWTAAGELSRRVRNDSLEWRYKYDELGNLTGVRVANGDTLSYLADASTRRVGRFVNGVRTHTWLYADQLNIIAELDGSGALVDRYAYGTRGHVPDLLVRGSDVYRLITDHLGSVRAVVKVSDGEVKQRIDYDPWGVRTLDTNPGWQNLGYAGGLTDTSTGLVRFGARDYEPPTGRWTQKDPEGVGAFDANVYAYVHSRPTSLIDTRGAAATTPIGPKNRLPLDRIYQLSACTGRKVAGSIAPGGIGAEVERFWYLYALVHRGGPLDLKNTKYTMGLGEEAADAAGNFNFGVLGTALGYSRTTLLLGAGIEDLLQQFGDLGKPDERHKLLFDRSPYLDDREDTAAIEAGILFGKGCECP